MRQRVVAARGQALAEFALVLPVMMFTLLVAVDFGRLFFTYIAVNNAAREATNYAAANAADPTYTQATYRSGVVTAALQETNVQAQGGAGGMTVSDPRCFSPATKLALDCHAASDFAGGIGNQVTVSVTQPFTFVTPLVGELFGGQLTLAASATAPILNPSSPTINEASPSPGASPTPSPSPTPSLPPGATPTPTPPPTCTVPDFYHTYWADPPALQTWHDVAGFTGTLTDASGGKLIQSQTLVAGTVTSCTASMTVSNKK